MSLWGFFDRVWLIDWLMKMNKIKMEMDMNKMKMKMMKMKEWKSLQRASFIALFFCIFICWCRWRREEACSERLFSLFVVVQQPFNGRLINPAYCSNKTTLSQVQHLQKQTQVFLPKVEQNGTKVDTMGKMWTQSNKKCATLDKN